MSENKKSIYDLELHEFLDLDSSVRVFRVDGGFIYHSYHMAFELMNSTFVPDPPQELTMEVTPPDISIANVDFESVDELTKKQAAAFNFLKGYFSSYLESKVSVPKTFSDSIKSAFQDAYRLSGLEGDLMSKKHFDILLKCEDESCQLNPKGKLHHFFIEQGSSLSNKDVDKLLVAFYAFIKQNAFCTRMFYDDLYMFVQFEFGLSLEYDEMMLLCDLLKDC